MTIEERRVGDVAMLDIKGRFVLGEGDEMLKLRADDLVRRGVTSVILNLEGVPYIDSVGLAEIVSAYTTLTRHGGTLKLVGLTERVRNLFTITKLVSVFEIHDTEARAVQSFG
jgi:anti-sigma B factor antagonist